MKSAALMGDRPEVFEEVYGSGRRERIAGLCRLFPTLLTREELGRRFDELRELEIVFSTWGMLALGPAELDRLPGLKIVFYGASSVKGFAAPLLDRGITVVSAWSVNALPVAEFVLAQILLATKGYFRKLRHASLQGVGGDGASQVVYRGNFGETVAILGAGQVGRRLVRLLRDFALRVVVADPHLTDDEARDLGVEKVPLEEAFSRGYVISNHIPMLPETRELLNAALFARMRKDATFINIANGHALSAQGLAEVLAARRDVIALLDTLPPAEKRDLERLQALPNVFRSPHLAGSIGDERLRIGDAMIEECERWLSGRPLLYRVTKEMLARNA
jgi:phosphoglycerate dehydrogenase-like enzyme